MVSWHKEKDILGNIVEKGIMEKGEKGIFGYWNMESWQKGILGKNGFGKREFWEKGNLGKRNLGKSES